MKRSLLAVNIASSPVKQLDARVKLICLFCISLLMVLIDTAATLGACFCLAVLLHLLARTEPRKLKVLFIFLIVALWGTALSQSIFYAGCPRTVILTVIPSDTGIIGRWTGGIQIYREGLVHGLVQGLRFLIMTTLGMLVVWTTEPQDMLEGMLRMRIPYGQAFMLVTAFRFIPILLEEVNAILLAARIKGFRPFGRGMIHPLRTAGIILNPLLSNLVRKSSYLAISVECRGFSLAVRRLGRKGKNLHPAEAAVILSLVLAVVTVISVKVAYLLYFHGLYYAPFLRPVYSLARNYF